MRIIKEGKLPEKKLSITNCPKCETKFEFDPVHDLKFCWGYTLTCPFCKYWGNLVDFKLEE